MRGLHAVAAGLLLSWATAAAVPPALAGDSQRPQGSASFVSAARLRGALAQVANPVAPPAGSRPAAAPAAASPVSGAGPASAAAVPAGSLPQQAAADPLLLQAGLDPLPSWRDGPTKQALLRFVREASQPGGPGAIPLQERIAVFDNDGTLWSEQPLYFPFQFCVDQIRAQKSVPPAWRRQEPFASALRGDRQALLAQGSAALGTLLEACASGMDTDAYAAAVRRWLSSARHPLTGRPYTAMVFQPMLELLQALRGAGFRTYIVSGGESEFMRPWTAAVYGVPPEQVIGSRMALTWQQPPGQPPRLLRQPGVELVVDGPNKPIAIQQVLGRRPVAAFGNSDGDLPMLEWTTSGSGPRIGVLLHHTDARREWAYDRSSAVGRLDKALDLAQQRGWIVIDMARDWLQVYPRQPLIP